MENNATGAPSEPKSTYGATVIIPANNEESYIGACLSSLLAQDEHAGRLQIVVAANGCTDRTVPLARSFIAAAREKNWELVCDDSPLPGKLSALNRADQIALAGIRIYLDADVECSPHLIGRLIRVLDQQRATYATGRLILSPPKSVITRAYGRLWQRLPFVSDGAAGAGLYAVNAAGRARWAEFPDIISDDTYVRLHFTPSERIQVGPSFTWPLPEGLANLVRVRRRQDVGVQEIHRLYPQLIGNEQKGSIGLDALARIAIQEPLGFLVYALVKILVKLQRRSHAWVRGR